MAFLFWADAKLERTQTQMTQQERQGPMLRLRASQNRKEEILGEQEICYLQQELHWQLRMKYEKALPE